ncbi:MAG: helix-turn-helix domain-containing protein [Candidatus Saccharibacteria bacterium]|nr:helix-turn-helix domain-containing protein [Candidatus Saccharibacteria bacterium]
MQTRKKPSKCSTSFVVGLMRRYSNFGDRGKRLRRLAELPVRGVEDDPEIVPEQVRLRVILSAEDKQQLAEAYLAGSTIRELARRFGINRETVSKILADHRIERRYHQTVTVDMERARELQAQGLSINEIAAALGVGRTTLVRARRAARLGS